MPSTRPSPGVLLRHKPVGVTSAALVREVQQALDASPGKAWKVCHGGALDPFARGLLPILVGPATKLFERLHEVPKTYEATVAWGLETDTGDASGTAVTRGDASGLTEAALDAALRPFMGWAKQVPPNTSNKRVDGERAYVKAHRGDVFTLPPCDVFLLQASWASHQLPGQSVLRLTCAGGFYVRSLARDLGRALGCGAHLEALWRKEVGPWVDSSSIDDRLLQGPDVLPWLPTVTLDDALWGQVKAATGPLALTVREERPRWFAPTGFPTPPARMMAVHQGRVVALLRREGDGRHSVELVLPGLARTA